MNIFPSYSELKELSKDSAYTVLPVSTEILSDFITPIEALRILKNVSSHCYLLESAKENDFWGRYTFLGFDPKLEITCRNEDLKIGDLRLKTSDPAFYIRQVMSEYRAPYFEKLPSFSGGLVGYFAFDFFTYTEPSTRRQTIDDLDLNDLDLMLFDKVIAFDHIAQKIVLIINIPTRDFETSYNRAVLELEQLIRLLKSGRKFQVPVSSLQSDLKPAFNPEQFEKIVNKAKDHIYDGDIFQIVLSNQFSAPFTGSLFNTYRQLRTINPSPYMFYLSGTDIEIAGASPETLVKLDHGTLYTFPLAGTRPRGKNEQEDQQLIDNLLQDEKELAEHDMLVDLGRNDLGKISEFGSVEVEKFHQIEKFSHVMHLGSTVKSRIRKGLDALDAVEAVLPAGTLSGAPKIRAVQLISELEGFKRGLYGGAVGYIDFSGNMDLCIAIRLVYKKKDQVIIHSGAGIVADSDPQKEYQEILNKAMASFNAVRKGVEMENDLSDR